MDSLPVETLRWIIQLATTPDEQPSEDDALSTVRTIQGTYENIGLHREDAHDVTSPPDTVSSLKTKTSLMLVSHQFSEITRQFLFESLYLPRASAIRSLGSLTQLGDKAISTVISARTRRIHVRLDNVAPDSSDSSFNALASILRTSSALQELALIIPYDESLTLDCTNMLNRTLQNVSPELTHLRVFDTSNLMWHIMSFLHTFRKASKLIEHPAYTSSNRPILSFPRLARLDMLSTHPILDLKRDRWDFSSLTNLTVHAIPLRFFDTAVIQPLPALRCLHLVKSELWLSNRVLHQFLAAASHLDSLTCQDPLTPDHPLWHRLKHSTLSYIEVQSVSVDPQLLSGTNIPFQTLRTLRSYFLPFSDGSFPALRTMKLSGLRRLSELLEPNDYLARFLASANTAAKEVRDRGIHVEIEE